MTYRDVLFSYLVASLIGYFIGLFMPLAGSSIVGIVFGISMCAGLRVVSHT